MGGVRLGAASSPVGGKEGEGQETASSRAKQEGGLGGGGGPASPGAGPAGSAPYPSSSPRKKVGGAWWGQ